MYIFHSRNQVPSLNASTQRTDCIFQINVSLVEHTQFKNKINSMQSSRVILSLHIYANLPCY